MSPSVVMKGGNISGKGYATTLQVAYLGAATLDFFEMFAPPWVYADL